jgi:hypothetical protein
MIPRRRDWLEIAGWQRHPARRGQLKPGGAGPLVFFADY